MEGSLWRYDNASRVSHGDRESMGISVRVYGWGLVVAGCGALAGCSGGGSAVSTPPVVTPGTIGVASVTASVMQSAGTVAMAINRTGGTSGNVSVNYATADGTAVAGTDYTKTVGSLVWSDGDATSRTVTVPVTTAPAFGGTRTFTLGLSGALNGASIGAATETVNVTGSLAPPLRRKHRRRPPPSPLRVATRSSR